MDGGLHYFVSSSLTYTLCPDCTDDSIRYPVYSFFLPVYSFWRMDDFSWGNTRLVVGEGNNKKVIVAEDEKFDESMIPLKKFSGMSYKWKFQR